MNLRTNDGKPISSGDEHQVDAGLAAIAEEIVDISKNEKKDSGGIFIGNGKITEVYKNKKGEEEDVDIIENEKKDSGGIFIGNGKITEVYKNKK